MDNAVATEVLSGLGANTEPSSILIYPKHLMIVIKQQTLLVSIIKKLQKNMVQVQKIIISIVLHIQDMAKQMTSIMSQMIDTITLILTAFAGISLIVSSIMIGNTNICSVVERTKEIGILRAIGARKKRYYTNLYCGSRSNRFYIWSSRCYCIIRVSFTYQ